MPTREPATCLISGYLHPLNRELEGLSERSLPTEDEIKSLMEKIQSNPHEYRLTA